MDSQFIKEQLTRYKNGMLNESKVDDSIIISDGYYDIIESCFMIHESLTLDGKTKFFANKKFIQQTDHITLEETVDSFCDDMAKLFKDMFDIENISAYIALCNAGLDTQHIAESIMGLPDTLLEGNLNKIKSDVVAYTKKFNSFKDFSTNNQYLDEGLIKVPQKTLSFIEELIDVLIYNWAVNSVYDESAYELMKGFLNSIGLDVYNIKTISDSFVGKYISFDKQHGFMGSVDIKIPKNDVPYPMDAKYIPLSIIFDDNLDSEGVSDELAGNPTITIKTKMISELFKNQDVLNNPIIFTDGSFIEKVKNIKDTIMSTVVHELMHVMQHTVFAKNELKRGSKPKSVEKGEGDYDDYITAQVEFDPSISDVIFNFKRMLGSLEEYLQTTFDNDIKRELLRKYLGSGYENDVPEYFKNKGSAVVNVVDQVFQPPYFVQKIKEKKPEKYPAMVKKIYSELSY